MKECFQQPTQHIYSTHFLSKTLSLLASCIIKVTQNLRPYATIIHMWKHIRYLASSFQVSITYAVFKFSHADDYSHVPSALETRPFRGLGRRNSDTPPHCVAMVSIIFTCIAHSNAHNNRFHYGQTTGQQCDKRAGYY